MSIDADSLYTTIVSSHDDELKLSQINDLKTHIKKDFVDLGQVPRFFESLSIAIDSSDSSISSTSFSTICHLVKRVSMQDESGLILKNCNFLILPIIINKLGDLKVSIKNASRKALEAYWLSCPKEVETSLINLGLTNKNTRILNEIVLWLTSLIDLNSNLNLNGFLPNLVGCLYENLNNSELIKNISALFIKYYNLNNNKLYKFDLIKELTSRKIPKTMINSIVNEIGGNDDLSSKFIKAGATKVTVGDLSIPKSVSTSSIASRFERPKSRLREFSPPITSTNSASSIIPSASSIPTQSTAVTSKSIGTYSSLTKRSRPSSALSNSSTGQLDDFSASPELTKILAKLTGYKLDPSIKPMHVSSVEQLNKATEDMLLGFDNKETEFNWATREKHVIKLRSILRGNSLIDFPTELATAFKKVIDGVGKAVASLRTTLSTHGCNLVKEMYILLKDKADTLTDAIFPILLKLCSATKKIASSNAYITICSILSNFQYHQRIINQIWLAAHDKNVQPRIYCGVWIQIILVRFDTNYNFLNNNNLESLEKSLIKVLMDPNPLARQYAKDTYWYFYEKFPKEADTLAGKLEVSVRKGLERSKPKNIQVSVASTKPPKSSVKDYIVAKNKELKQAHSRSTSDSFINHPPPVLDTTKADLGKANRIGAPQRNLSQRKLSTENSFQHKRNSSTSSIEKFNRRSQPSSREEQVSVYKKEAEIIPKSVSSSPKIVSPKPVEEEKQQEEIKFDKHLDPILNFLSSNQTELKIEGLNLLKYAIIGDEELSYQINELLLSISYSDPFLLKDLLTPDVMVKTSKFFKADDFLRVVALNNDVNHQLGDCLILIMADNNIYLTLISLITITSDIHSIQNNRKLTMQIIKFKPKFLKFIMDLLTLAIDKLPIQDAIFLSVLENLFNLMNLAKSTDLYNIFEDLLRKFYASNAELFKIKLNSTDLLTKEEISCVVKLDQEPPKNFNDSSEDEIMIDGVQTSSLYEMTMVNPANKYSQDNNIGNKSDMTMIIPNFKKISQSDNALNDVNEENEQAETINRRETIEIHSEASDIEDTMDIDEDEPVKDVAKDPVTQLKESFREVSRKAESMSPVISRHSFGTEKAIALPESDESTTPTKSHVRRSDAFPELATRQNSIEIIDNFAQVQISETKALEENERLQELIEKTDPFINLSQKKKSIEIYHDEKNDEEESKEYSYSKPNWFNFELARFSFQNEDEDILVDEFKRLCVKVGSRTIEGKEFINVLNYLQTIEDYKEDVVEYYNTEGIKLIEASIWEFFGLSSKDDLSASDKLSGLILIKQLLVNKTMINLEKIWNLLIELTMDLTTEKQDLGYAIQEIRDEMLNNDYNQSEVIYLIEHSLSKGKKNHNPQPLIFILSTLYKLLNDSKDLEFIDNATISGIDDIIFSFVNSDEVEIRRYVVLIYGKFLNLQENNENNFMDSILSKLPVPQRKLVEYYSR